MDWITIKEWIIGAAAVFTALGVIAGVIGKFYRQIKSILDKLTEVRACQQEDSMRILRLTIMSEEMPLEERIAAGDKYIAEGGNGTVKHKYEQLLAQLDRRDHT